MPLETCQMPRKGHTMAQNRTDVPGAGRIAAGPANPRSLLFEDSLLPTLNTAVLLGLLTLDMVLIILHIAAGATFEQIPVLLNIAFDYSLGEFFGYAKWLAIIVMLLIVSRRTANPALLACAAIFAMMLADDSLQIHETLGKVAVNADRVGGTSWATGQTIGEIAVWIVMIGLLLPVIVLGLLKSTRAQWPAAFRFLGLIALFAVFGGLIDALHMPVQNLPFGPQLADLLEDGGEMVVASVIVAHAAVLLRATE